MALLCFLPWAALVESSVGYWSVLRGQLDHSLGLGKLFVTTPDVLHFYLSQWMSPPLLLCAAVGLLFILVNRQEAGLFLLMALVLFALATLFYMSFPRLVLPLIPGICLCGGYGLESIARRVGGAGRGVLGVAGAITLFWNLAVAVPLLNRSTDSYRQAADYLEGLDLPLVTQLSKNYYFYENKMSLEIRRHSIHDLDSLVDATPSVLVAIDPIVHRLPRALQWMDKLGPRLTLLRSLDVDMYEPVYYQGFDPTRGFDSLPRSVAPAVPGNNRIQVYRIGR